MSDPKLKKKKEDSESESGDDSQEEIDTSTLCPYKKVTNFFSGMFSKKSENPKPEEKNLDTESPKIKTEDKECLVDSDDDIEKEDDRPKCPFGFTSKKPRKKKKKNEKEKGKCPFGYTSSHTENSNKNNNENSPKDDITRDTDDDLSSDDEDGPRQSSNINKGRRDPINKHFNQFYEIPCFGNYDFIFFMRGNLSPEEWLKKTEKLRKYPRHLKYTLFYQAQEKLQKVHEAEFPRVFFIYDDIKQKANRLYKRKKYKDCIEHCTYAYGLLKWIQFKDKKRQSEFVVKPSLDAVLDEEIEEKHVYLDDVSVEEDSYKACIVYLLEMLAYAHMEMRQYHCAIECLDECAEIAEDKVPDVYFRRSQARTYNRYSTYDELNLALDDIEKAIKLKSEEKIYKEHKEILLNIIKEKSEEKLKNIRKLIERGRRSRGDIDSAGYDLNECIFARSEDADKQYKILKEMKSKYNLAVKFFTETKNDEQLKLTYNEYESFHKSYENFKFFYKFKYETIDPKLLNQLDEEEKKLLMDNNFMRIIDQHKARICEDIFGSGDYNIELFQYALEKVFEEERKEQEAKEKEEEAKRPKVTWSQYLMNLTKSNFSVYLSIAFVILSIFAIGAQFYFYGGSSAAKI
jgi:hypothetical protein